MTKCELCGDEAVIARDGVDVCIACASMSGADWAQAWFDAGGEAQERHIQDQGSTTK